jgi:hypothetical protein
MPVFSDAPEINKNLANNKNGITANGAFERKIFSEQSYTCFSEPNLRINICRPSRISTEFANLRLRYLGI